MTLDQLVGVSTKVAEKQLLTDGHCATMFAAADPVGKITVLTLHDFSTYKRYYLNMLRVFCGVFPVDCYAVSFEAWAAVIPQETKVVSPASHPDKIEILTVIGTNRTTRLAITREIKREPLGLGPAENVSWPEGDLIQLLPPVPLTSEAKELLRTLWDMHYKPAFGGLWVDPNVEHN